MIDKDDNKNISSKNLLKLTEGIRQDLERKLDNQDIYIPIDVKPQSETLGQIRKELINCERCKLCHNRKHVVFGVGSETADLVFVGEGPGHDEDIQGLPFVGKAGQLLTKIINAMNFTLNEVYITNIVKCRPPQNRNPQPDEIAMCEPFLLRQLEVLKPKVICTLGKFAAQTLLKSEFTISQLRGKFYDYNSIKLMPTYHPAFLLRNPGMKRPVWEDVQKIQKELER
ncbi:MAG: uracil-DNA glycosylase [Pseudomonadota bacterium]